MNYGIEVQGQTTLLGWDDSGAIKPWTELQAWAGMIRLRGEFRKLGVMPIMRVIPLEGPETRQDRPVSLVEYEGTKRPRNEAYGAAGA